MQGWNNQCSLILFITYNYILNFLLFFRLGWVPTLLLAQARQEFQLLLCLHLDGSLPHYPPFHHTPRPCQPADSLPQPSDPLPPTPPFTAPMTVASAMILLQPLRRTTLTMRLQGKLKDIWNIYLYLNYNFIKSTHTFSVIVPSIRSSFIYVMWMLPVQATHCYLLKFDKFVTLR